MNEIVLDIETQNRFGPDKDPRKLKVSLVGIYRYENNQFFTFLEKELVELWPLLEHCNRIIGYNLKWFDLPVLNNYYPGQLEKFPTLDLYEIVYNTLGFSVSLNDVAGPTLGMSKTANGLMAIKLFREGKIEELKDYCLNDVKITRDLYEYGKKHGEISYENKLGKGKIKVDFSLPVNNNNSINLTLPI